MLALSFNIYKAISNDKTKMTFTQKCCDVPYIMFPMLDKSPNRPCVGGDDVDRLFLMLFLIVIFVNMLGNILGTLKTHWKFQWNTHN